MADSASHDATDAKVPDDATDTDKVPGVHDPEAPTAPEAPEVPPAPPDFTLPSLDADAARLTEHPAWPWVCLSADGDGVAVDYTGLSVG